VFEEEYGVKSKFNKVVDYKNLNELGERIKPFSFRTTRKECLDLPPEVDNFLWVDLAHHAQHLYNRVNQQMKLLYDETVATGTDKYMGQMGKLRNTMQRICGGFNDEANLLWLHKIEATIEYIDNMVYEGHQVVIFAHYVAEVKTISQMLTSHGIYTPYICGETDLKDRASHIKDFQDGKIKVLVCQEQAGGVGITLTAADVALFYSMNFDAGTYEQAKARIYRIGQEKPVTYVHLLAKGTVDEAILRVVKRKLKWADNTLSGIEEVLKCSMLKSSKQ
jgi:SNF2 family DNA or RNA helicase